MVLGAGIGGREEDVNPGSATLAPRSALLETHLRAWGNTGGYGGGRVCGGIDGRFRNLFQWNKLRNTTHWNGFGEHFLQYTMIHTTMEYNQYIFATNMWLHPLELVDIGDHPSRIRKRSLVCHRSRALDVRAQGTLLSSH